MSEYTNFVSIDVSKAKLDYYDFVSGHSQYKNGIDGFRHIVKGMPDNCCVVMEATGSYHHLLASYL